jgi:hypothetical protein
MLIHEFMFNSILFMPKYVFVVPGMCDICFIVNIFYLQKLMVRFFKPDVLVLLAKPDVPVCQTRLSDFDRHNICFFLFNYCEPLVMCIT